MAVDAEVVPTLPDTPGRHSDGLGKLNNRNGAELVVAIGPPREVRRRDAALCITFAGPRFHIPTAHC